MVGGGAPSPDGRGGGVAKMARLLAD